MINDIQFNLNKELVKANVIHTKLQIHQLVFRNTLCMGYMWCIVHVLPLNTLVYKKNTFLKYNHKSCREVFLSYGPSTSLTYYTETVFTPVDCWRAQVWLKMTFIFFNIRDSDFLLFEIPFCSKNINTLGFETCTFSNCALNWSKSSLG